MAERAVIRGKKRNSEFCCAWVGFELQVILQFEDRIYVKFSCLIIILFNFK